MSLKHVFNRLFINRKTKVFASLRSTFTSKVKNGVKRLSNSYIQPIEFQMEEFSNCQSSIVGFDRVNSVKLSPRSETREEMFPQTKHSWHMKQS